jgi:hypothetical protein
MSLPELLAFAKRLFCSLNLQPCQHHQDITVDNRYKTLFCWRRDKLERLSLSKLFLSGVLFSTVAVEH